MRALLPFFLVLFPSVVSAFISDDEIAVLQKASAEWALGERIAFWAEQFVDTPYDTDPMGAYVTGKVIVADDRVDCMYHVFRSVELAKGKDPADSLAAALDLRFPSKGVAESGQVLNYEDRFRYGEDMIESGKWGKEITSEMGETVKIRGGRNRQYVAMIKKRDIPSVLSKLRNGDIVFFIKDPAKRSADEIVGHMGIIKAEEGNIYLISAFGQKDRGGKVKKVLFSEYSTGMPFVGIRVSRME